MATRTTTTELRKMSPEELRKEVAEKRASVAKMHIAVAMRSQKDTAKYNREKKDIARMLTILNELESAGEKKSKSTLKAKSKASTVPASK